MGAAMSHARKTRKPLPARLDGSADQENATTPSKASTSRAASPQSSRRDRKSRLAANTAAKITKPSPAANTQSTPASAAKAKPLVNGTANAATPAKQPEAATPSTSTRPRRRDRKSTRANDQTPGSEQEIAISASNETGDKDIERTQSQSPNKRSNTVTLNVGRKPLESLLAQQTPNGDASNIETPADVGNGDYHFEYDTDMYRNNYGLDGHIDAPTSPTSLSTTTSNAARTSGRTRKPTIRALESFESERRHRRPRAPSVKATAEPTETTPTTNFTLKTTQGLSPSKSTPAHKPDIMSIAKLIYKLAAEALAPDFVPAPEADTWISELQQRVDQKEKEQGQEAQKETEHQKENENDKEKENEQEIVTSSAEEEEVEGGRQRTPPSKRPYSDNVQVSTPWTDEDGWEYTGQVNKYEEEYVIVPPKFEWYRPNNTYGDDRLPLPPVRLRSLVQAEKDRALGYPPLIGDRNTPIDQEYFLFENVPEEKAKLKIKEAARERGIFVSRFMTPEEIQTMINNYDSGKPPVPLGPLVPPVIEEPSKAKEPTRKRRRLETASTPSKPSEVDTPRSKRRRQDKEDTAPSSAPESSAGDDQEKPSLKVKLIFENKQLLREHITATQAEAAGQSKKRPHSEIEDNATNTQSPKAQKPKTSAPAPAPSTPAKGTENPSTAQVTPGSAEQTAPETTPGGRPRRRAADALMANFQRHAEARALRSERAKMGHAKRKGTPLKTVTGVHGDTVESPIRPPANPMKTDPVQH
ncbi:hypothetical protein BDV10DRAFT_41354 [Aspergillus recurvatus]